MAEPVRSLWSGTITFGLVSVPVALVPATRSSRMALRMLGPSNHPLRRRYVCSADGEPLDRAEIVRGYEIEGAMVPIEDEELEGLAPDRSRSLALERFVRRGELSPIYFERGYYLVPDRDVRRPYHLLAAAMEATDRAGIGTLIMRGTEYLVAILSEGGVLRVEILRFSDELRDPEVLDVETGSPPAEVVQRLRELIRQRWHDELPADQLMDQRQQRLRALVEKKRSHDRGVIALAASEPGEGPQDVVDLMAYLKQSLGGRKPTRAAPKRERSPDLHAELRGLSKKELYDRARKLGIAGRSRMSKSELIAALAARE